MGEQVLGPKDPMNTCSSCYTCADTTLHARKISRASCAVAVAPVEQPLLQLGGTQPSCVFSWIQFLDCHFICLIAGNGAGRAALLG